MAMATKVSSTQTLKRRYLGLSFGTITLALLGFVGFSQFVKHTESAKEGGVEEDSSVLQFQDVLFPERRLEKVEANGKYKGECTSLCGPTGGFLSLVGAMSGQCDCVIWEDAEGEAYCKDGYENTCCGVLDNGGGVVLYIAIVFYSFLGLAVICDNYFCESLSRISAALKLSDDVAGATFMAAGSSAPELFTSLVTVLITGGSEGLGTITGSAIFNMMIIVGATAMAACADGSDLPVWWFPLMRDSIMYFVSTFAMFVFMLDYQITWLEGFILVLLYGIYVYIMKRNADLSAWAQSVDKRAELEKFNRGSTNQREGGFEMATRNGKDLESLKSALASSEQEEKQLQRYTAGNPLFRPEFRSAHGDEQEAKRRAMDREAYKRDLGAAVATKRATEALMAVIGREAKWSAGGVAVEKQTGGEFESEDPPSAMDRVMDMLSKPIECVFSYTVPDCAAPGWETYYVLTFLSSIMWIGILSFVMVDFSVRVGCVVGIPGLLMGLVFIAAGTSVPDALSSIAVGKSGMGDMAVANVLGSNIFNILLGLGLPWFMQALITGKPYPLNKDEPVAIFVVIMLIYLCGFLLIIKLNDWKLNLRLANTFFAAHMVFVIFAVIVTFVDVGI